MNQSVVFVKVKGDEFGPMHKYPIYSTLSKFLEVLSEEFNISTVNLAERLFTETGQLLTEESYQSLTQRHQKPLLLLDIQDLHNKRRLFQQSQTDHSDSENGSDDEMFLALDTFTSAQNKKFLEEVQQQGIDQYAMFGSLDLEDNT
jgi:hypothetical protein